MLTTFASLQTSLTASWPHSLSSLQDSLVTLLPTSAKSLPATTAAAATATTLLVLYVAYVRSVRYRRRKEIEQLPDPRVAGFDTAHQILKQLAQLEFPFTFTKSLEFGLFRTYGTPRVSKLLSSTKELTHHAGRRYDDTELIIREMYENDVGDVDRAMRAVRRMNYLHSKYKINNADYVYTLTVFVCEPLRWIERYEWRKPTEQERHALYVFWREIGVRMGIKDIPPSVDAFFKFNEEHEQANMKYAESNKKVADGTVALFLSVIPPIPGFRAAGDAIVRSLMDQPLCDAFGMQPAPVWLQYSTKSLLLLRGFVIRYFFLPRSKANRRTPERPMEGKSPARYCPVYNIYENSYPDGYSIETIGPKKFENDPTLGVVHEREADSIATK